MRRALVIGATIAAALVAVGVLALRLWRGPDPAAVLASIERPPSPVLSPEDARHAFRVAPGFEVELVAAEPLVVDPVAMDWDDEGRLYVVEMRGFMPDLAGTGEDAPLGRVVRLEDEDGDGRMDTSRVFLDGLVLPRAIVVLPEGVLVAAPPDLWLCRDADGDGRCTDAERTRLGDYAEGPGNVEHLENGLLPGLDGWLYSAKSRRRLRLAPAASTNDPPRLEVSPTLFRGQWGLAMDDAGRLYSNHNSAFLYVDLFPGEYALRHPATATAHAKPGLTVDLAPDERVYGVRVAPGLNRADQPGALRRDGRQDAPTAVSGVAIQRGDQYGPEFHGDAFVPESAGAVVARFDLEPDGMGLRARHVLDADPDWSEREFLASTDERFRPVDVKVGPDGALWVIDMYRGVIQHAHYVSDYLRDYVRTNDLEAPGATGRIWRIVRTDRPIDRGPPSLATTADRLRALDHPNGWVRDRAQRGLVAAGRGMRAAQPDGETPDGLLATLRALDELDAIGRSHALWTLAALDALDVGTWRRALADPDPRTRETALHAGAGLASTPEGVEALATGGLAALDDPDPHVRLQAIHTLGSLPPPHRPVSQLVQRARDGDALVRQAVLSGLTGFEEIALDEALAQGEQPDPAWLAALAGAIRLAGDDASAHAAATRRLLDRMAVLEPIGLARALARGLAEAGERRGAERIVLDAPHAIFEGDRATALGAELEAVRRGVTWPGDTRPGGARALTAEEERLRTRGGALFQATCATCHGEDGRGLAGLAPPLAGSPWVRDADEWLLRIVLQGLQGPIEVGGERFDLAMPGHAADPRFDDATLAGLATWLRRAWGHADRPVTPDRVASIRAATASRHSPWTVDALRALPVEHRLDRYTGRYRVPIVGVELEIVREDDQLALGRSGSARSPLVEAGDGLFLGDEGVRLRFDATSEGPVDRVEIVFGEQRVEVARVAD